MTRLFILFFILINFIGCNKKSEESKKIELMFLDDYIFPASQFFDSTKVPDAQISDNNAAAYFMIGGSDAKMDALTDLQYR